VARAPHHKGPRYVRMSAHLRHIANATPDAVCWRCGRTLQAHSPKDRWTAGHTIDGSTTWKLWTRVTHQPPPGDWLAPEASSCNMSHGAAEGNRRREPHTEAW
jgi:hypothetical protein